MRVVRPATRIRSIGVFRVASRLPQAAVGEQAGGVAGASLWLLPNPSGLQARYQLEELVDSCGR